MSENNPPVTISEPQILTHNSPLLPKTEPNEPNHTRTPTDTSKPKILIAKKHNLPETKISNFLSLEILGLSDTNPTSDSKLQNL